jgi:hypothetical protein
LLEGDAKAGIFDLEAEFPPGIILQGPIYRLAVTA